MSVSGALFVRTTLNPQFPIVIFVAFVIHTREQADLNYYVFFLFLTLLRRDFSEAQVRFDRVPNISLA